MIPQARVLVGGVDVSCDVLTGVTINHGRASISEQPDAATASLDFTAADRTVVDRLTVNAPLIVDAVFPDGSAARRFTGTVTDVEVSWESVDAAEVAVIAASNTAILGRVFIGSEPWPLEDDGDRAARILSVAVPVPYSTTFPTDLDGWSATPPASAVWDPIAGPAEKPAAVITWGGTVPLPLQIFTRAVTGLLPGGGYTATATVKGGTGGGFIASQPGSLFGSACPPGNAWTTVSVTGYADATGKIDVQFWPHSGAASGSTFYVSAVTVAAQHQVAAGQIDPGTVNVLARDVDRQPCLGLLQELANDAGGLAWHTRDGAMCYADAEHRRNTVPALTLASCDVLMSPAWTLTTDGLTNEVTVAYGAAPEGGDQPTVTSVSSPSVGAYGLLAISLTTRLADAVSAQQRADTMIARAAEPAWNITGLPVEVGVLDDAAARTLLGLEIHDLLIVTGMPSQSPAVAEALWVEGWAETITPPGSWQLTFAVSAYCRTAAFLRWDDTPEDITWDTVDPDMTWDDVACIGPTVNRGYWDDTPADERWDTVPAEVSWDAWNDYVGA